MPDPHALGAFPLPWTPPACLWGRKICFSPDRDTPVLDDPTSPDGASHHQALDFQAAIAATCAAAAPWWADVRAAVPYLTTPGTQVRIWASRTQVRAHFEGDPQGQMCLSGVAGRPSYSLLQISEILVLLAAFARGERLFSTGSTTFHAHSMAEAHVLTQLYTTHYFLLDPSIPLSRPLLREVPDEAAVDALVAGLRARVPNPSPRTMDTPVPGAR